MKKILVIAIATFFLSANINAQVRRNVDPAQKVQRDNSRSDMKKAYNKLDLSPAQKEQMKQLLQETKQQRDAIKNNTSLSNAQKAQKMRQLKEIQKQKASAILTPAQRAQAKDYFEDRKDNNKEHNKNDKNNGHKFGKKYQKEIASLDLSEAQKSQIKVYIKEGKQQAAAIKNDASLTPAQKKAKLKNLKADAYSKMENTLTPAQRAKAKVYIEREMKDK